MQRRLCSAADKYNVDMKKIRFELILELKALAEQAQQKAIDTHPSKVETKQNWSRLAAYISQVINGIGKTYDEAKIEADLQKLEIVYMSNTADAQTGATLCSFSSAITFPQMRTLGDAFHNFLSLLFRDQSC